MSKAGVNSNRGDDYQRSIALKWALEMLSDPAINAIEVEITSLGPNNTEVTVDDIAVFHQEATRYLQCKKTNLIIELGVCLIKY